MKEIKEIINAYDEALKAGKQMAVATVVSVEGSSYRQPGARMLITEDGRLTGAISGGCLEGDALKKSLHAMAQNKAIIVTYDTTDEDDAKLGVGLGCNGIIHILIEPVNSNNDSNPIRILKRVSEVRQRAVIITLFNLHNRKAFQPGTCFLYTENEKLVVNGADQILKEKLLADAENAINNELSQTVSYSYNDSILTGFVEYISPAVSIVIAGVGNDVKPLVSMAHLLGWEITIVDGRNNLPTRERFPNANQLIVSKPALALSQIYIDERTVFVLMTHNYNYDLAILQQLVTSCAVYIGVLGPKKKLTRMLDELQANSIYLTAEQQAKIYGPAGLNIGAESPEEIALSIVAEIKAVLSGKDGQSLKNIKGAIHSGEKESTRTAINTSPL